MAIWWKEKFIEKLIRHCSRDRKIWCLYRFIVWSNYFYRSFALERAPISIFSIFFSSPMALHALHLQHFWSGIFFWHTDHEFFVNFDSRFSKQLVSILSFSRIMKLWPVYVKLKDLFLPPEFNSLPTALTVGPSTIIGVEKST